MSRTYEQIAAEAVAVAWDAEIERRIAQLDNGEIDTIPFEEVMAEQRAKLRQPSRARK
jgi:putative addiction module component (TIGR02574 family)